MGPVTSLWGKIFKQQSAFHMRIIYWPNLKSVAQIIFKIFWSFATNFYRSRDLGHAPLGENYWRAHSALQRGSCLPNLKTLAEIILKICLIVCQRVLGVTWPRPRPLWGKLLARPLGFSKWKLCTKFKVSSSSSFEDMFNRMPKILGVTWPRPRPFWGKLFERPLGFPQMKLRTKFEVSSSSSFEDTFDCMPKILGVTWPRPRPLWGKFCIFLFRFAKI